jgi:hypothetical protein
MPAVPSLSVRALQWAMAQRVVFNSLSQTIRAYLESTARY